VALLGEFGVSDSAARAALSRLSRNGLLPAGWRRAQARELFIGCYDLLGPLAAGRVRQIITRYSPELAGRAAYHSLELKLSAAPTLRRRTADASAGLAVRPREAPAGEPACPRHSWHLSQRSRDTPAP
jgi:hypothetical protein